MPVNEYLPIILQSDCTVSSLSVKARCEPAMDATIPLKQLSRFYIKGKNEKVMIFFMSSWILSFYKEVKEVSFNRPDFAKFWKVFGNGN